MKDKHFFLSYRLLCKLSYNSSREVTSFTPLCTLHPPHFKYQVAKRLPTLHSALFTLHTYNKQVAQRLPNFLPPPSSFLLKKRRSRAFFQCISAGEPRTAFPHRFICIFGSDGSCGSVTRSWAGTLDRRRIEPFPSSEKSKTVSLPRTVSFISAARKAPPAREIYANRERPA